MCDEQNGFRSGRCTIDHVGSLTSIIETRIKKKSDTFVAFIDFSKAYDHINREILWYKLARLGISDQFIEVLKSLCHNVHCTTRINDFATEWFDVSVGLKQGCILSPVLFNAFMEDLVQLIRDEQKGVTCGDLNVPILLYANDIVLLSGCEENLQSMLHILGEWCCKWGLTINSNKSKVMHFRSQSVDKTGFQFICADETLEIISQYKYLRLILIEHLDYLQMTKCVAKSASRALGFLICKDKALGGMPFKCFTKCYNSLVQPVIDYGSTVWGTKGYSCVIHAVQNRACRCFLGLGKYAPTPAVAAGRGHGMVNTPAQTMAWCNEKMAQDVIHGQLFFDKENFYSLKEPIKQFL